MGSSESLIGLHVWPVREPVKRHAATISFFTVSIPIRITFAAAVWPSSRPFDFGLGHTRWYAAPDVPGIVDLPNSHLRRSSSTFAPITGTAAASL
jgi:hypothetical protein